MVLFYFLDLQKVFIFIFLFNLLFLLALNDEDVDEGEPEADDKSGMVTRMIWMEYPKAAGRIPGLVYAIAALAFQILRVYTDFWLSEWMEKSIYSPANVNR